MLQIEKGRLEVAGLDDMLRFGGSTSPKTFRSTKFDDVAKKQFNTITQNSGEQQLRGTIEEFRPRRKQDEVSPRFQTLVVASKAKLAPTLLQ